LDFNCKPIHFIEQIDGPADQKIQSYSRTDILYDFNRRRNNSSDWHDLKETHVIGSGDADFEIAKRG